MKVSSLLKGGIYEVSFGYDSKTEGYTTLMSDIPELYEMVGLVKKYLTQINI
jgi:hypothetical protein